MTKATWNITLNFMRKETPTPDHQKMSSIEQNKTKKKTKKNTHTQINKQSRSRIQRCYCRSSVMRPMFFFFFFVFFLSLFFGSCDACLCCAYYFDLRCRRYHINPVCDALTYMYMSGKRLQILILGPDITEYIKSSARIMSPELNLCIIV